MLVQPFPLPFALTDFCLLVGGEQVDRCSLFSWGCHLSASLQLLFAHRELLRCSPCLFCWLHYIFFLQEGEGCGSVPHWVEGGVGLLAGPQSSPFPLPCPCLLAKLLNEISWGLSVLVHWNCCFPYTPTHPNPEPVSISLAQKRPMQGKSG